ncbi:unnamed protein product [Phyllotreta striolata]|uniref:Eukaryotic translation initiation factor 4E binding protein n=1 Tax=Phyllotreta striolata TaxID=444603 RepID=A0A9N9TIM7_PHYSR|nr:unnamed protein product [Phyllotreta striolata]
MSASSMARQAIETKAIPIKRVVIDDASDLPSNYSSTPGGTLFSTTPGGSKIVYEKSVLMNLRNSPISKTPPAFEIPACISGSPNKKNSQLPNRPNGLSNGLRRASKTAETSPNAEDQFEMDL